MTKAVLLVEDDGELTQSMTGLLGNHNYNVVSATNAREAIMKLKKQEFCCVITDIKLANGSGEEVIEYLRKSKKLEMNENVPIIVVSGFLDKALIEKIMSQVNGALVKPFKAEALIAKLDQLVKK